ncbi:hypothetical protein LTR17_001046 [Elasticomyces elasticus]|nr:hypothetical protein LTR17_001046 [Elasticomyces elasticus]
MIEIQKLIREHRSYDEENLLAALQSALLLLIILLFGGGSQPPLPVNKASRLLVAFWEMKNRLADTGLFLEEEVRHTSPDWSAWVLVSAKRRTILALHHMEWAWSVLHGYPELACLELGPLPAPSARYLWEEQDERTWYALYQKWRMQWKDGYYAMSELFPIQPGAELDERTEAWLAEADAFGVMMMGEVGAVHLNVKDHATKYAPEYKAQATLPLQDVTRSHLLQPRDIVAASTRTTRTSFSMAKLMIYGTGYTGGLVIDQAKAMGLDFMVAGRSQRSTLAAATTLNVPHRVFDLFDASLIDSNLGGVTVLLNCSGPFQHTAEPLIDACIRNKVHYLDTSAELISYEYAEQKDKAAQAAGVMLIPGCGGSVAMLGCLTGRVLENTGACESVERVDIALNVSGAMSRGSLITAQQGAKAGSLERRGGALVDRDATTQPFDFANEQGSVACFPVTLPDLLTLHKFFGVPNVKTFAYATGTAFASSDVDTMPAGPTKEERDASPYNAAIQVTTKDGAIKRAAMHSVNGYSYIGIASAEAARRILAGEVTPGFQLSSVVFGYDFADSVAGEVLSSVEML